MSNWTYVGSQPLAFCCQRQRDWLEACADLRHERGLPVLRVVQVVGNAPQSNGAHLGGCIDTMNWTTDDLLIYREMGGAAHHRTTAQGFTGEHAHIAINGDPHLSTIGRGQVADLAKGLAGLGLLGDNAGTADTGPRNYHRPLRTMTDGIAWARQQGDDMTPEEHEMLKELSSSVAMIVKDLEIEVGAHGAMRGQRTWQSLAQIDHAVDAVATKVADLAKKLETLSGRVDAIPPDPVDIDALAAKVAALIAKD